MKTLKKLLVVLFAVIMAMTVAVFTACQPVETENNDKKDQVVNTETQKLINALLTQSVEYVDFNMNVNVESIDSHYNIRSANSTAAGKIDVLKGNGDIVSDSGDGTYSYLFLRGWDAYNYSSNKEVTDFDGIELKYLGSFNDYLDEIPQLSGIDLGQVISAFYVPATAAAAIEAADQLNALTVEEGKVTVDISLMMRNALLKVKAFLDKINDNTTIGQFLALEEVKGLIEGLTVGMTGAELQAMVAMMLLQIEMTPAEEGSSVTVGQMLAQYGISLSALAVPADANSSAYDYLIKFISSDEINTFIDKMLEMSGSEIKMPANLKDVKLGFILNALKMPSIQSYKDLINNCLTLITETGIFLPAEGTDKNIVISGVKIIYTLNNRVLTGQRAEAKIVVPAKSSETTCKITADITFPSTAPELVDLSGNIISGEIM